MKIRKAAVPALFIGIFGLGSGFVLSGCSGINKSLEKEHIMNNGCFITCYNNKTNKKTFYKKRPHSLAVRTLPSHGSNTGSNPVGAAIYLYGGAKKAPGIRTPFSN